MPERRPLAGKRVVVTRAPEQSAELSGQLRELGAEVLFLPAVAFTDPPDSAPLDCAIERLASFHWLVFTSQNAVRFFVKRCRALGVRLEQISTDTAAAQPLRVVPPMIAAVGPATAEAAAEENLRVDYVAREFRGEAMAGELGHRLEGKRVLLPRSDRAAADLPAALGAHGAEVVAVVAYHTGVPDSFDRGVLDAVGRGEIDVVTFMSPSAFHHLAEEVGLENLRAHSGRILFAAIGPVTAKAIREAGLPVAVESAEATSAGFAAAIARHFEQRISSGVKTP